MAQTDQTFIPLQNAEKHMLYPDFDAMWNRLESQLPGPEAGLLPVDTNAPKRRRVRKVAMIAALTAVLATTPVIAALSYHWDGIVPNTGIQSALQQGLGQAIEQSATHDGATITIHTAVVDDNRTVLLYSLSLKGKAAAEGLQFAKMELTGNQGRIIEGRQKMVFNKERNEWSGYFEADWAPENPETDVRFTVRKLRSLSKAERELIFDPFSGGKQAYSLGQDGIGQLSINPVPEGDNVLLSTAVTFSEPEARSWARPQIGVYKDGQPVEESIPGAFGKPGEKGEYTGVQHYRKSDLLDNSVKYKLLYTREDWHIDKEWAFDLHLDKQTMLSGTVKKELHLPMEDAGTTFLLEQMTVTPTQIRITGKRERYASFPLLNIFLDVNGTLLRRGMLFINENPEELLYVFDLQPGIQVHAETPITLVAKHEVVEHKDAKEPIRLTGISEEKKTMTTLVGGYTVKWTYYKHDGNLYVQSECDDPAFGGVNQTYMGSGANSKIGNQMTMNFTGSGNNLAIDEYPNFSGTEAEINITWYKTENPDKELRIKLNG